MIPNTPNDNQNVNIESYKLSPTEFNSSLKRQYTNSLTFSHVNIRSMNRNFDSFKLLYENLLDCKFHVIGLSEIWQVTSPDLFSIDGYNLEINCRDISYVYTVPSGFNSKELVSSRIKTPMANSRVGFTRSANSRGFVISRIKSTCERLALLWL